MNRLVIFCSTLSQHQYERGYFGSISSGRDFQFFSAHFFSKSRTDTRVGAFNRYTLPTYGKTIENICNIKKNFFDTLKLASFKILDHQKLQISEISEVKNSKKIFYRMIQYDSANILRMSNNIFRIF